MSYLIRKAEEDEINIFLDRAETEGWNPGVNDAKPFWNADPEGFLIGELNGEIIATKSAVRYKDKFGFMGFYIVKEGFRNKGYGLKIWKTAFDRLKDIPSGMDGVVEQQQNYAKSGYVLAYRQIRFEKSNLLPKKSAGLSEISKEDFELVTQYDSTVFPAERPGFLKKWLFMPESLSLKAENKENITGYGTIRLCRNGGFKIGPIFADNPQIAKNLFYKLIDRAEGKMVYLDISEINAAAVEFVKDIGMKYSFETARMYNGGNPERRQEKVFGVTTFELG